MSGQVRECSSGSLNLERVVVKRPRGESYTTDFMACAEYRLMYFVPQVVEPVLRLRDDGRTRTNAPSPAQPLRFAFRFRSPCDRFWPQRWPPQSYVGQEWNMVSLATA